MEILTSYHKLETLITIDAQYVSNTAFSTAWKNPTSIPTTQIVNPLDQSRYVRQYDDDAVTTFVRCAAISTSDGFDLLTKSLELSKIGRWDEIPVSLAKLRGKRAEEKRGN